MGRSNVEVSLSLSVALSVCVATPQIFPVRKDPVLHTAV